MGRRAQLIRREGQLFLWSRGEEIITDKFPELSVALELMPDGTVLDGELICYREGKPLNFNVLQRRIGRRVLRQDSEKEAPAFLLLTIFLSIREIHQEGIF